MIRQNDITQQHPNWYAVYTRCRAEFTVKRELTNRGVSTYLPTINSRREWKDRKKWIYLPIFPGYLFVNILPEYDNFAKVANAKGVVALLGPSEKKPTSVSDEEIHNLKGFVENYCEITVSPHLKIGARVRIKQGPLAGVEGVLERKPELTKKECWVFIRIELLGRSVGAKIDADAVEAIYPASSPNSL